jgi:5-methylcytosine-specific restriction endonuclease McrA
MSTKQDYKRWRKQFNQDCLERDNHKCVFCPITEDLDVHHITDRHELENGGYVMSNGITLCSFHHLAVEEYHMTNGESCSDGMWPDDLYKVINSSKEMAIEDAKNLK